MKDPDVRATIERALEAGQRREDIDMVVRARYAYEWGGGDELHLELAKRSRATARSRRRTVVNETCSIRVTAGCQVGLPLNNIGG